MPDDALLQEFWQYVDGLETTCESEPPYQGTMDFREPVALGEAVPVMSEAEWQQFSRDHAMVRDEFRKLSDPERQRFVDSQARKLAELDELESGTVDPERAELDQRVQAFAYEHGCDYAEALGRVLYREGSF